MASTGYNYINQLTPDNGAVQSLRELLFLSVIQSPAITATMTSVPGAIHGKKIGGIGKMGMVGAVGNGCKPDFNATSIATQEKEWDLGEYEITEGICYRDIEETLARYSLRTGTDRADLTGGDYIDIIVNPKLKEAMTDMIWRLYWLGDKAAETITGGGVINDAFDPKFFRVCDGFFKKLLAITAANANRRTVIAANSEATFAAQRSALKVSGVAML